VPEDFSEYVAAHRASFARHRAAQAGRAADARATAERIARHLVDELGARRVVLIGSLARGDFGPHSDIDLVVEGLPGARFWSACTAADRIAGTWPVDLIPADAAHALVHQRVREEGQVLAHAREP
jgi:predicted nucleotidyltransferase